MAVGCSVGLGIRDVVGILDVDPVTGAVVIGEAEGDFVISAAVSFSAGVGFPVNGAPVIGAPVKGAAVEGASVVAVKGAPVTGAPVKGMVTGNSVNSMSVVGEVVIETREVGVGGGRRGIWSRCRTGAR